MLYVAPRFTSWDAYAGAFEDGEVLDRSLLIKPSEIDSKLAATGEPDGRHRIVYDGSSVYVCPMPMEIDEVKPSALADQVRSRILARGERVDNALKQALESFGRRRDIRTLPPAAEELGGERAMVPELGELTPAPARLAAERQRRLAAFRAKARSEADAVFMAAGVEAWAAGGQLIAVTAVG